MRGFVASSKPEMVSLFWNGGVSVVAQLNDHFRIVSKPDCQSFSGHVDTHFGKDIPRCLRTARLQEFKVLGDEGGTLFLVHAVQGQHEQIAEAVGIAIERAGEDVGDAQPFPLKFIGDFDGLAELLAEFAQIGLRQLVTRGTFSHHLVREFFKADEIGLAQDRGVDVIN